MMNPPTRYFSEMGKCGYAHDVIHQHPLKFFYMPTITTAHAQAHVAAPAERSLVQTLVQTESAWTPAFARIALGAVMLPHGLQKLLGWFGGYGFTNTLHWFTDTMHVPWILGVAAILVESVGALALLAGFATRAAAAGVGAVFITAIAMVHAPHGFFMNWSGAQKGEGIEYFILGLALVAVVIVQGGGAWSVDRAIARRNG
jgi:putative oxidoreductase